MTSIAEIYRLAQDVKNPETMQRDSGYRLERAAPELAKDLERLVKLLQWTGDDIEIAEAVKALAAKWSIT